MANEIRLNVSLRVQNGQFKDSFDPGQILVTQTTAAGGNPGTVDIGTSEEAISFGDVTPGIVVMRNLDATNFVTYGPEDTGAMVTLGRIDPKGVAIIQLASSVTLRMKADTATCKVLIKGYAT